LIEQLRVYLVRSGGTGEDSQFVYLQLDSVFRYWLHVSLTGSEPWKGGFERDFFRVFNNVPQTG
jgi:hypothetical protein